MTPHEHISVGESGLLARIAVPLLAALNNGCPFTVEGSGTLVGRSMSQMAGALAQLGVNCTDIFPLEVSGKLSPGRVRIDGRGGSQTVTGLMFALVLLEGPSEIIIDDPSSKPYIYLTQRILREFGVRFEIEESSSVMTVRVPAPQKYCPPQKAFARDGDWSAAANLLVAYAIRGSGEVKGLDVTSAQADVAILDVLDRAGAVYRKTAQGVLMMKSPLHAFEYDASDCPDIIPAICMLAAYCQGVSRIGGLQRLHNKESDRAAAIEDILSRAGVPFERDGSFINIHGQSLSARSLRAEPLAEGVYPSYSDHRIVMALLAAGLSPDDLSPMAKSVAGQVQEFFMNLCAH